jgi:hypothetical protein
LYKIPDCSTLTVDNSYYATVHNYHIILSKWSCTLQPQKIHRSALLSTTRHDSLYNVACSVHAYTDSYRYTILPLQIRDITYFYDCLGMDSKSIWLYRTTRNTSSQKKPGTYFFCMPFEQLRFMLLSLTPASYFSKQAAVEPRNEIAASINSGMFTRLPTANMYVRPKVL